MPCKVAIVSSGSFVVRLFFLSTTSLSLTALLLLLLLLSKGNFVASMVCFIAVGPLGTD